MQVVAPPIVNVIIEGDPKQMGINVRTTVEEALIHDDRTQRALFQSLFENRQQVRRLLS